MAIDHVARYKGSFGDMNARNRPHYFDPDQLYDLEIDPYCRTNLAGDPAHIETLATLRPAGRRTPGAHGPALPATAAGGGGLRT